MLQNEAKQVGKAAPEYRQLLVELEALEGALSGINGLHPAIKDQPRLEALRAAVMVCQRQLQDFLIKMAKFDKALGIEEGEGKGHRQVGDRVLWATVFRNDVKELRATLEMQLLTVSLLMSLQILESIHRAETDRDRMKTTSENLRETSQRLLHTIQQQHNETLALLETQNAKIEACTAELSMSRTQCIKDLNMLDKRLESMISIKAELQKIDVETAAALSKSNVKTTSHEATDVSSRLLDIFATAVTTVGLLSLIPQLSVFGRERYISFGSKDPRNFNLPVPSHGLEEISLQEWIKDSKDVSASPSDAHRSAKQSQSPKPKIKKEKRCSALDQLDPHSCNEWGHSSSLACPFKLYALCDQTFCHEEQDEWIQHSLAHFRTGSQAVQPPTRMCCPFCRKDLENFDGVRNWKNWMKHIFDPIQHPHHFEYPTARPPDRDPLFMIYLFDNHLIDVTLYEKLMDEMEETRQRRLRLAAYDRAFKQKQTGSGLSEREGPSQNDGNE